MPKYQATPATREQIIKHAAVRRTGRHRELAYTNPVLDCLLGGAVLAAGIGGMVALWIAKGAGL